MLSLLLLVSDVSAKAWAVLVMMPVTSLPTVAVMTMVMTLFGDAVETSPSWQMLLTHVPWVELPLTKVKPAGNRSFTSTSRAVEGPVLLNTMVYVTCSPAVTVIGPVLLTPTSASVSTSVSVLSLLLTVEPSDEVTVSSAWLVRSAPSGVSGSTVPVAVMLAVTSLGILPRSHTTMSPDASSVMVQTLLLAVGTL